MAGGTGYPITVTVNVASGATSPETNTATVSGGGSLQATATDTIVIQSGACFIATGHPPAGAADVQAVVNESLGTASRAHDLNQDGKVNVTDIQIVINAVLNLGCTI